jgi:CubicO group peptidase (beta-lactamase class C family)
MRGNTLGRFVCGGVAALFVACGGGGDGSGPPSNPIPPAPASGTIGDGRLAELVEWARNSQSLPALGVIVMRNGQVVERAVMGRRSASAPNLATTEDRWHLGSITKSMTATLAALMVEDGAIDWDTTPLDVWPELTADINAGFRDITLRQLLSHTSGMERDDDFSGASDNAAGTLMEKRRAWAARLLARAPAVPTRNWSYSNMGYVVAGAMLETRAQTPYEMMLQTRIFAPLGMAKSGFGPPGNANLLDEPWGHLSQSSGFEPVSPSSSNADIWRSLGPAGLVHASLDDMARYLGAHLAGQRGVDGLLSASSFQTLHSVVASDYALGWSHAADLRDLGSEAWWHTGSNQRWFAAAWFSPPRNEAVFIVANGGGDRASAAVGALDQAVRRRLVASP